MSDSSGLSNSLAAIETEAVMHFSFITRVCGCIYGAFGPLKIHRATDGHDNTKRVRIRTTFQCGDDRRAIEGVIVLKNVDGQWMLYCEASNIDFGDYHVGFSYARHTHTYHTTTYYTSGALESMDINMVTGVRIRFADPDVVLG
jgi:hypothetical protein